MNEDVKRWLDSARENIATARYLFNGNRSEDCAFYCQQAVEKILKAYILNQKKKVIKTHDLFLLAKEVNLPESFFPLVKELTVVYVAVRYPDTPSIKNIKMKAEKYLHFSEEVLQWAHKKIY